MRLATCLCVLVVVELFVYSVEAKKTFSTRRKSGNNNRRGGSSQHRQPPPPPPATPHRTDTSNTNFLNAERTGSSHGTVNTHYRGSPFNKAPSPDASKQTVPHANGPIGFEGLGSHGNQKLGFDKVNSEVQHKPGGSHVPSAPAYPAGAPPYPGKPVASAPNGPPPAYPGYGSSAAGAHSGGFDPPPAYPGRPVNAPPVYSANNPSYGQRNPAQPGVGGYPNQQGQYPYQHGGYQQSGYPHQGGYQQSGYPHQGSYPGQQNMGGNFGNYPNQGFGSYPSGGFGNSYPGGYGQSHNAFGGNAYGGSPFGHSNAYGGSPFPSSGIGGNMFGGSSHGNPHYSPNNFGYSNNPGFFGSHSSFPGFSGGNNYYGQRKRSWYSGLPIPIPIPIPLGMFGGFGGGRSYNHRVLDTFVKNKTISTSDNTTTSVFILNNSTVTPCTTDQFIYDSLNVTVLSCTAGNCTALKVFTTTNVSGEVSVHAATVTMCLEPNTTYSSHADNVNPTVSGVHKYWMRVCKSAVAANSTGNITEQEASNVTVIVTDTAINETVTSEVNTTTDQSPVLSNSSVSVETTTLLPTLGSATTATPILNSTIGDSTVSSSTENNNSSLCETFDCSWIEMCLPSVEIVDRCSTPDCPFTRTGYQPCVRLKMCQSPNTPISTFATLNTTISRIDQFNNVTSVNDVANLTLISYISPSLPAKCSQNVTDPACQPPPPLVRPQDACGPANSTEAGVSSPPNNSTVCVPTVFPEGTNSTGDDMTTTETPNTTPIR